MLCCLNSINPILLNTYKITVETNNCNKVITFAYGKSYNDKAVLLNDNKQIAESMYANAIATLFIPAFPSVFVTAFVLLLLARKSAPNSPLERYEAEDGDADFFCAKFEIIALGFVLVINQFPDEAEERNCDERDVSLPNFEFLELS